ncbi:MAG TPA: TetR/AcrR family transcriptional regulator [Ktedonobacteraceae bacterium]
MFSSEEMNKPERDSVQSSWKERQRQERERLIVQAAEEILLEKGLRGVSMDEIAARVGISKGTLYAHFAKKEDLFLALLEQELRACMAILLEITEVDDSDVSAKLETIIRRIYQELLGKRFQLFHELYGEVDLQILLAKKREQAMEIFVEIGNRTRALLEAGKASGVFDATLPTEVMIESFFTMISPRAYKLLVVDQGMPIDVLAGHMASIYLKGIAAT